MRWRSRRQAGETLVGRPGPAKVEPLDVNTLHDDIRDLKHGRKRTHDTQRLYEKYREQISRRDLQALVEVVRRELQREAAAQERRIDWLMPGTVWSMDDLEKHLLKAALGHLHLVTDLGSRYILRALGDDEQANGWQVAMNLEQLFHKQGPPLFLKVDGGSNFCHHEVRGLLGANWVIPLVSPRHYPPYNGGVEREHQEILRALLARIGTERISAKELRLECEVCGHEVNHLRREILGGRTACQMMEAGRRETRRFGRRERAPTTRP